MRISVKFKLLPIILIGIAMLTGIFYYASMNVMENNLNTVSLDGVKTAKEIFYNLQANDEKMLSSTMDVFFTNKEFKEVYLKNNRTELYNYGQPIFKQLKEQFGITHFYFHLTNGTNFVRLHSKDKYGDLITRKTFKKSVDSNGFGSGLELGQTAFALRVVHPYYDGSNLIGYVELGEEIDHFLKVMKEQTGNDYGIFIKKQYINQNDWKSTRSAHGLKDNYNDLEKYVVIDTTREGISEFAARDEDRLSNIADSGEIFQSSRAGSSSYVTGGFPLYDAGGVIVGTVVVVMDVTSIANAANDNAWFVLIVAIISAIVISIIVVLLVNLYILKPLDNIVDATTKVAGGDFSVEIKAKSDDEIGDLAMMIEGFKKILVGTAQDLEKAHDRK
jgi:methyl-accepting chemotaxis protein